MPESSDREPKAGETGDEKGKFDDVWDALVERASVEGASDEQASTRDGAHDATEPTSSQQRTANPEPRTSATKPWDDAARAKLMEATSPEPTEPAAEKSTATKPWDDAARALAKEAAASREPIAARSTDDMKMDALMAEAEAAKRRKAAEDAAKQEEAPAPQKAGRARPTTWLDRSNDLLERSDELMERLMTEPPPDPPRASSGKNKSKGEKHLSRNEREPAARRKRGDHDRDAPAGDATQATPSPPEAGAGRNRIWILLLGIFALFGIWALMPDPPGRRPVEPTLDADRPAVPLGPAAEHPGAPPQPAPVPLDTSPLIERGPHEGEPEREQPPTEEPTQPPEAPLEAEPTPTEPETPPEPEPRVDSGDIRTPPAGTASEHAEAFRRLPVASGDGPPVGGVGERGVHLDHISLGSSYEAGTCTGKLDDFSISDRDRVNVCLRVVHPREKEELVLLWQKDGDTVRRSKLTIPNTHAYKTRAYLMLREQFIGRWVVRVLSARGVELASHEFQVVR